MSEPIRTIELMDDETVLSCPRAVTEVTATWTGKSWVLQCNEYPDLLCETLSLEDAPQLVAEAIRHMPGQHATDIVTSITPDCSFSVTLVKSQTQWSLWIPSIGASVPLHCQNDAVKVAQGVIAKQLNTHANLIQIKLRRSASVGCPTPGKTLYHSKLDAKIALASTQRSRKSSREETRVYRCPCGGWHLTSHPKMKGTKQSM